MRRLIWKEFREKRLLTLALIVSTGGLILLGDNYTLLNSQRSGWTALSMLAALCLGASTYSSELGGAADFARSRPISWKKMLAAKLAVGSISAVAAVFLTVLLFRIMLPARYSAFFNPVDIRPGVGSMFVTIGVSYLLGFLCSTIMPSVIGGLAVCSLLLFTCLLEILWYQSADLKPMAGWSFACRYVGAAVATVLISRFGMTLSTGYRSARFAATVLVFTAIGVPLNFIVPDRFSMRPSAAAWNLSPTGRYAGLMRNEPATDGSGRVRSYLVRTADGRAVKLNGISDIAGPNVFWYKNTVAAYDFDRIWMGHMGSAEHLDDADISVAGREASIGEIRQSPNGRYLLLAPKVKGILTIADLDRMTGQQLTLGSKILDYWWNSDTEIGYIDRFGPHIKKIQQ